MSSTRSIIATPPFAANALTVIPPTPVAGVSYRDPTAGPASSPDGWPYAERVNSAEFNQILFQATTLVELIDKKGILGWSDLVEYTEAGIVHGSDGNLYTWIQASGPTNGGAKDPISQPAFWAPLAKKIGAFTKVVRQVVSATGTYTPSPGMIFADVEIVGGGGGGGGAVGAASPSAAAAGGGGSGAYVRKIFSASQIGATASVSIGAAGSGGAAGINTGGVGGASTFTPSGTGGALTASGGFGSVGSPSGGGTFRGPGIGSGGATATGGDINIPGTAGGWSYLYGVNNQAVSGRGGSTLFGPGGQESQEDAPGNIGVGFGSGGGGGAAFTTSKAGGNGKIGVCVITEYCTQ